MAEQKGVAKYSVIEDSPQKLVFETRGSKWVNLGCFSIIGGFFLLAYLTIAEGWIARLLLGSIMIFAFGTALWSVIDKERWEFDETTKTLVFTKRLKPWKNLSIARDDIAQAEIGHEVMTTAHKDEMTRRTRYERTDIYTLYLILKDSRRIEVNRGFDPFINKRICERITGAPAPNPKDQPRRYPLVHAKKWFASLIPSRSRKKARPAAHPDEEALTETKSLNPWISAFSSDDASIEIRGGRLILGMDPNKSVEILGEPRKKEEKGEQLQYFYTLTDDHGSHTAMLAFHKKQWLSSVSVVLGQTLHPDDLGIPASAGLGYEVEDGPEGSRSWTKILQSDRFGAIVVQYDVPPHAKSPTDIKLFTKRMKDPSRLEQ
jgi:hypothetical protein